MKEEKDDQLWQQAKARGWDIGLLFNYLAVYKFTNTVEREYG